MRGGVTDGGVGVTQEEGRRARVPARLHSGAASLLKSETKRVGGTTKGHKRVKRGDGKVG